LHPPPRVGHYRLPCAFYPALGLLAQGPHSPRGGCAVSSVLAVLVRPCDFVSITRFPSCPSGFRLAFTVSVSPTRFPSRYRGFHLDRIASLHITDRDDSDNAPTMVFWKEQSEGDAQAKTVRCRPRVWRTYLFIAGLVRGFGTGCEWR
jgi:hypothetical protein